MSIRNDFPSGESASELGGESDGKIFTTAFAGASLASSYAMIRQFLTEEGYGELPLPADEKELEVFKLPTRNKQILLFEDNGYVHNPVKILFPMDGRRKNTLILKIYNEQAPKHLLRFHGRLIEKSPLSSGK